MFEPDLVRNSPEITILLTFNGKLKFSIVAEDRSVVFLHLQSEPAQLSVNSDIVRPKFEGISENSLNLLIDH